MPMTHRDSVGFVYVARTEHAIKVGFTADVGKRIRQLDGTLLASAPGTYRDEQELVRRLAPFRSPRPITCGREWFTNEALDVLWPAWVEMFGQAA